MLRADSYLLIAHGSHDEIEQAGAVVERSGAVDVGAFETGEADASALVTE